MSATEPVDIGRGCTIARAIALQNYRSRKAKTMGCLLNQ